MNQVLIFVLGLILGVVVGGFLVWGWMRKKKESGSVSGSFEAKESNLIKKQAEEKRKNMESILILLETSGRLTNNDIELMLGISDATSERYLQELEKEGKVKQVGRTGKHVFYEKI